MGSDWLTPFVASFSSSESIGTFINSEINVIAALLSPLCLVLRVCATCPVLNNQPTNHDYRTASP